MPSKVFDKGAVTSASLFNVRVNGVIVAESITRDAAQAFLGKGAGLVQVYLADRPLESRPRVWSRPALPRKASLSCGPVERAALLAKLAADGTMDYDECADALAAA